MKKSLIMAAFAAVFASAAHADTEQQKLLLGFGFSAGAGEHEITLKSGATKYTEEGDVDSTSGNIRLGLMLKNNNRFVIGLESTSIEDDGNEKYNAKGVRLDWQFVYGENRVQPYWGLGLGMYSSDDLAEIFDVSSLRGFSFQLMGGIKIAANEKVEIDLNIQHQAIAWQDINYTSSYDSVTLEQATGHTTLGVGVDFKF